MVVASVLDAANPTKQIARGSQPAPGAIHMSTGRVSGRINPSCAAEATRIPVSV